jgi:hypothetical protein
LGLRGQVTNRQQPNTNLYNYNRLLNFIQEFNKILTDEISFYAIFCKFARQFLLVYGYFISLVL